MGWVPPPTGNRDRQPQCSDGNIQAWLTRKALFGIALRQTTGFVESLLGLVGLDWMLPALSVLSRRQKTSAMNIPYRGSQETLSLLIYRAGIEIRAIEITASSVGDAPMLPKRSEVRHGQRGWCL